MTTFSPREIVSELDRFIIGQHEAKRAVAIALRNRWRRQQLDADLRDEVMPKNILMIGPTGVGKTEISRRLAKLAGAPFIKVEATKFTEVGYVGRDVEQIVRDLVEIGIGLVREKKRADVQAKAHASAEERVLDALVGSTASPATRDSFRKKLRDGQLDDKEIEIEIADSGSGMPGFEIPGMPGANIGVLEAQKAESASTLASLKLAKDKAIRDLAFTVMRAPYDGIVGNRSVEQGDLVSPGQKLAVVVPMDKLYVVANFKETQLARLVPGQKVKVWVDAMDGESFEGTVSSLAPASGAVFSLLPPENATGNFTKVVQRVPVRIDVPAEVLKSGKLRAGLSVVVDVDSRTAPAG